MRWTRNLIWTVICGDLAMSCVHTVSAHDDRPDECRRWLIAPHAIHGRHAMCSVVVPLCLYLAGLPPLSLADPGAVRRDEELGREQWTEKTQCQ